MTANEIENDLPLKSLAAKWLFHQGASTVFAVVMLVGLFYTVIYVAPALIREIHEGQKETAQQLSNVADKFDREQERTFQFLREQQLQRQSPVAAH